MAELLAAEGLVAGYGDSVVLGEQQMLAIARAGEFGVILVEQHARLALELTQQVIVLDRGRVVHRGGSGELLRDPATLGRLVTVA